MRRLPPLTVFVLSAFGWIVGLTLLWSQVAAWTSHPVGMLSQVALDRGAPTWVRQVHLRPGSMEVDTSIMVPVAEAGGRQGELTIEVNPMRYAYGLPIFLALLFAARGKGLVVRAIVGYLMMLPAQAFSLSLYVLMQLALAAQLNIQTLWISQWQLELIVYAYQVGSLILPTLIPILLWLWMDRKFVAEVVMRGWQ